MACPLCGEQCRCSHVASDHGADDALSLAGSHTSVLIDPDGYDPTEEMFSASVYEAEETLAATAPAQTGPCTATAPPPLNTTLTGIERIVHETVESPSPARMSNFNAGAGAAPEFYHGEGWREEVQSRLSSYRARRRRNPEGAMPLDFGETEPPAVAAPVRRQAAVERVASRYANRPAMMSEAELAEEQVAETNIIEFPKPPAPPEPRLFEFQRTAPVPMSDELADAVPDSPRILEAPEPEELPPVMPPVTAITLDGDGEADTSEPVSLELPLRPAAISQRVFAGTVDLSAVIVAAATFGLIFVRITGGMPQSKLAPAVAAGVVAILWSMYQYIFLVYAGTTPGLQISGLALRDFHGERLRRNSRRSRAIGIVVAAVPLGLGLVWALLDQEMLCWHDRISHSYVVEGR